MAVDPLLTLAIRIITPSEALGQLDKKAVITHKCQYTNSVSNPPHSASLRFVCGPSLCSTALRFTK